MTNLSAGSSNSRAALSTSLSSPLRLSSSAGRLRCSQLGVSFTEPGPFSRNGNFSAVSAAAATTTTTTRLTRLFTGIGHTHTHRLSLSQWNIDDLILDSRLDGRGVVCVEEFSVIRRHARRLARHQNWLSTRPWNWVPLPGSQNSISCPRKIRFPPFSHGVAIRTLQWAEKTSGFFFFCFLETVASVDAITAFISDPISILKRETRVA